MPLRKDFATARRLARNILVSRRNRRQVAARAGSQRKPAPGTIKIAVYFADTSVNMYQLRQWYEPLKEISSTWPVAIIARAPSTVLTLWDESPVPAMYLQRRRPRRVRAQPRHPHRLLRQPERQELPDVPVRTHVARFHQPR